MPVRLRELTPLNDEDWLAELLLRRFQSELFDYYRSKKELSVVTYFADWFKTTLHPLTILAAITTA